MDFTINDLLKIDACENAVYVGDKANLSNVITGVTILESPDISSWINGGEVILTSFYPIKEMSDVEMDKWANELANLEISALIVKTNRVFDEIPAPIYKVFKKRSIPFIKLPKDVAFIDITYPVMGELFHSQVNKLKYFKEIHNRFTELSLQNVGSDEIIETLEKLIGNPVSLLNEYFQRISCTNENVEIFYHINEKEIRDHNYNTKFSFYKKMAIFPKLQEREAEQIFVPIKTIKQTQVNLVIHTVNKTVSEYDIIAIESAATAISLEMVKQIAVSEVEKKFKNDLIDDLVSGKIKSLEEIYDRTVTTKFDAEGTYAIVLFKLKPLQIGKNNTKLEKNEALQKHYGLLVNTIQFYLSDAIIRDRVDGIIVLWKAQYRTGDDKIEINKIKKTCDHIRGKIRSKVKDYAVQVGIGKIAKHVMDLSDSYDEAFETLKIGQMLYKDDFSLSFNDLGIYRLLYQFEDLNNLKKYIPATLQKLLNYKKSNKADLIETLNVYLQSQQNISRTAEILFVHYKTVSYRLERIKEITGIDVTDPEDMLSIQVGLKIIDILERQK